MFDWTHNTQYYQGPAYVPGIPLECDLWCARQRGDGWRFYAAEPDETDGLVLAYGPRRRLPTEAQRDAEMWYANWIANGKPDPTIEQIQAMMAMSWAERSIKN